MKLKYKIMTSLAVVAVIGTGFAAWHFGDQTEAEVKVSVSVAGYSKIGPVEVVANPLYTLDTLNEGVDSNILQFTANYDPLEAEDSIDVSKVVLTYRVTFQGGLDTYVYPYEETSANSGISEGTCQNGVAVNQVVKWRSGKNPANMIEYNSLKDLLSNFNILIEVYANLGEVEEPEPEPLSAPDSIQISGAIEDQEIEIGNPIQLSSSSTLLGSSEGVSQDVLWASSDDETASVDQTGLVTGIAAGPVTISATYSPSSPLKRLGGDVVAQIDLIIVEPADIVPASVEINPDSLSVVEGATSSSLSAVVKNAAGDELEHDVIWSVINGTGSASISADRKVTGVSVGTAVVRATAQGSSVYGECAVTITAAAPVATYIEFAEDYAPSVFVSYTTQLEVIVEDQNHDPYVGAAITWSVPNILEQDIVEVSSSGLVEGLEAGTATVRATLPNGSYAEVEVSVSVRPSASQIIISTPDNVTSIVDGQTLALSALVAAADGVDYGYPQTVNYRATVEPNDYITVNLTTGVVTAKKPTPVGEPVRVNVTLAILSLSAYIDLTITEADPILTSVVIETPTKTELEVGETLQLVGYAANQYTSPMPLAALIWESSQPTSLSVTDGLIEAHEYYDGTIVITATSVDVPTLSASVNITIAEEGESGGTPLAIWSSTILSSLKSTFPGASDYLPDELTTLVAEYYTTIPWYTNNSTTGDFQIGPVETTAERTAEKEHIIAQFVALGWVTDGDVYKDPSNSCKLTIKNTGTASVGYRLRMYFDKIA